MRATYRVLAILIALGVVIQAAAIAFGTFGLINDVDGGAIIDTNYEAPNFGPALHAINGTFIIPALALILLIVSFFARVRSGVLWAGLTLLAVLVQFFLAGFAFGTPWLGLLHGINAFVILGLATTAALVARRPRVEAEAEMSRVET